MSNHTDSAKAITDFVNMVIGGYEAGFTEEKSCPLTDLHQIARNYIKDHYDIDTPPFPELWGDLLYQELKLPESTRIADKKLKELEAQGGEHVRDSKILRFPDGKECSIDPFGKVHWITPAGPELQVNGERITETTPSKELWSHNGEDDWGDFESIDQDQMFFGDDNTASVYRATGRMLCPEDLIDDAAIDEILSLIAYAGHNSREQHEHYIPDYWLEDFSKKDKTKRSLKELLASWLKDNGQTDYYTMDHEQVEVKVKRVDDELIEIDEQ